MALGQTHSRFGIVELAESTHGWLNGEDQNIVRVAGPAGAFLLRHCVQASGGVAHSNVALQHQYQRNGGGWNNITTTSAVVRAGPTTVFNDAQNCTKRLSGTGTFESSAAGCTHDGSSGGASMDIVANGNAETEIKLEIVAADVAAWDKIEFRVIAGGAPLNSYPVIPSVLVAPEAFPDLLLDVRTRNAGSGTTPSRTFNVAQQSTVRFRFPMSRADILDPANSFTYEFQLSTDNVNFNRWIGPSDFVGGAHNVDRAGNVAAEVCSGGLPSAGTWFVRLAYTINNQMGIGLERDVVEG